MMYVRYMHRYLHTIFTYKYHIYIIREQVVVDVKTFDGGTSEQNFKVKTTETLGSVKRRLSLSMGLSPEQVSNQHWRLCPLARACSTLPVATYSVHSS